ncbi:MAG: hypothetical protein J5760_04180, partial [Clostridia bacterium]|nr:hypothetical protein [Clostridia bacterium]
FSQYHYSTKQASFQRFFEKIQIEKHISYLQIDASALALFCLRTRSDSALEVRFSIIAKTCVKGLYRRYGVVPAQMGSAAGFGGE